MVVESKVTLLDLVSLNSLADIHRRMPKLKALALDFGAIRINMMFKPYNRMKPYERASVYRRPRPDSYSGFNGFSLFCFRL